MVKESLRHSASQSTSRKRSLDGTRVTEPVAGSLELGKHMPRWEWLAVLLADEPALVARRAVGVERRREHERRRALRPALVLPRLDLDGQAAAVAATAR